MSGPADDLGQARQLVRLRRHRLDRALALLGDARNRTERAAHAADAAAHQAARTERALTTARGALAEDVRAVELRLAMIDLAAAERVAAAERARLAADEHEARRAEEAAQRHVVLTAQGRHDALNRRAATLRGAVARRAEEAEAVEQEERTR